MLVAIDGTAGSGKSSTAAAVAEATGFVLMDSGLMYRAAAWACIERGTGTQEPELEGLLESIRIEIGHKASRMCVSVNGADVTGHLRSEDVSAAASQVAQSVAVRGFMLGLQRGLGERYGHTPGLIAEGRDMGTVVFPEADLKFFFTASAEVRVRRRHRQLSELGISVSPDELESGMLHRDRADIERNLAPLTRHPDAIEINTDRYTLEAQVALVLDRIRERARQLEQSAPQKLRMSGLERR